jgi:hypothetical protein
MSQTYYGIFVGMVKNLACPVFRLRNPSIPQTMSIFCKSCAKRGRQPVSLKCRRLERWVAFSRLFPNVNRESVESMLLSFANFVRRMKLARLDS